MFRGIVIPIALLGLASSQAAASDGPIERATLRGLKAVRVAVDPHDQELKQAGITAGKLAAMVEQRLQKGGVPIDPAAVEFVGLRVTAAHSKKKPSAVCLILAH